MQRFPLSQARLADQIQATRVFAVAMMGGAIWYFSIDFEPSALVLLGALIVIVIVKAAGTRLGAQPELSLCLIVFAGLLTGALAGRAATLRASAAQITAPLGPVYMEGWIDSVHPASRGVRLVLLVHAIDGLDRAQTPKTVRVTQISELKTEPGRFVRCWVVLRPPPAPVIAGEYAFNRQAWYQGLGAVGYVQGRCRGSVIGAPTRLADRIQLKIATWRRQLAIHVHTHAGERAGGFAAALASGDRSFMSADDQNALRGSGLAHLLAISGLHMGIVGGLVFAMAWRALSLIEPLALRWSSKKPAAVLALSACAAYLVISGASVSTQRAFVMAAILFGAVIVDRAALSLRSLAIAMIIVICLAPDSVLTPGFQMSFAATGALIATYETWQRYEQSRPGPASLGVVFWIKSLVVTSLVSSLATMAFAMFHFGRVAGLGIIANLVAMPIVSLISAPLAAIALLLSPFGLDSLALRAFGLSLEAVLATANTFAGDNSVEIWSLPQMPALSLAGFSAVIILICLWESRRVRIWGSVILVIGAMGAWSASGRARIHWAPSGDIFLEHASGRVERYGVHEGNGLNPLRYLHLTETGSCSSDTTCDLRFGDKTLTVERRPYGSLTLSSSDSLSLKARAEMHEIRERPTVLLKWEDVVRENGITLEWRGNAFHKLSKPSCGTRPWRICP